MTDTEFYDALRHFADSWGLAAMVVIFAALCAWPFRPGGRKDSDEAAHMIFKDDDNV